MACRDIAERRRRNLERFHQRTEARRAAGVCVRCGNAPPAEGRAMCEPCREDRRQAKRDRNAERRAAGLCVTCATPTPGGKAYCDPCAAVREERRQRNPGARLEADRRQRAVRETEIVRRAPCVEESAVIAVHGARPLDCWMCRTCRAAGPVPTACGDAGRRRGCRPQRAPTQRP